MVGGGVGTIGGRNFRVVWWRRGRAQGETERFTLAGSDGDNGRDLRGRTFRVTRAIELSALDVDGGCLGLRAPSVRACVRFKAGLLGLRALAVRARST